MSNFSKGPAQAATVPVWWQKIGEIGLSADMPAHQYRRGYAYNQMNFAGLCLAVVRWLFMLSLSRPYPAWDIFVNSLPIFFCLMMGVWMAFRVYPMTKLFSFFLFPVLLFYIVAEVHDRGVIAYFLPYLIYPFFFLHNRRKIIITFSVAAICFAASFTAEVSHVYSQQHEHNPPLEMLSVFGSLVLTFISLYAMKYQIWMYEKKILKQAAELEMRNASIHQQHEVMALQKEKLEESNRTKDKLFSIISHDLRVPIRGLQLLFASEADPMESLDKLKENLPELKAELKKTANLFENLLDWAKIQMRETVIQQQPVNLQDLVLQVTEHLHHRASEKNVCIDVSMSTAPVHSDKNILEIVLRNLVSNAIKFSGQGGPIFVRGWREEGQYWIEVEDRGVGIDETSLQKIHSKSFHTSPGTKNEKGTGLGLIICTDLVEKCGGSLTIASTAGKGTTVRIVLPLKSVREASGDVAPPTAGDVAGNMAGPTAGVTLLDLPAAGQNIAAATDIGAAGGAVGAGGLGAGGVAGKMGAGGVPGKMGPAGLRRKISAADVARNMGRTGNLGPAGTI
jgi:signal transduction histidine kinase